MPDHERAMLAFVQLADIARRKRQPAGLEKFLVLTAISAVRAGWPDVAGKAREAILTINPRHLLGGYATVAATLQDPELAPFLRRMQRFCTYEKAEALLDGLGLPPWPDLLEASAGEYALRRIEAALNHDAPKGLSETEGDESTE